MANTEITTTNASRPAEAQKVTSKMYRDYIGYLDASEKTVDTYQKALRSFYRYLDDNQIDRPTRQDVIDYRDALKETKSASTVHLYITAVRLFFQWSEAAGLYPNIAEHVKTPKIEATHKDSYLTSDQCKRVLKTAAGRGKRDYALMCLLLTTGLRTVEVSRAAVGDLDTIGNMAILWIRGKGHDAKDSYVKIDSHTEDALRDYLTNRQPLAAEAPLIASESNRNAGGALTTRTISGIVKAIFRAAGYDSPKLTAHSTRHTAVNLALDAGAPLQDVQQFCRHKNISTTMIYVKEREMASNPCTEEISAMIF